MRSSQVVDFAGCTYRQLDYWTRTGRIPGQAIYADGSGSQREFTRRQAEHARVIAACTKTGLPLEVAHTIAIAAAAGQSVHELGGGSQAVPACDPHVRRTCPGAVMTARVRPSVQLPLVALVHGEREATRDPRSARTRYKTLHCAGLLPPAWVDPTGTRRRIQALVRVGWPLREIFTRLGYGPRSRPANVLYGRQVHRSTALRVAAVYDELSMTPGPSSLAAARAAGKGWAPPLAWDDDTIDDPAAAPAGHQAGGSPRGATVEDEAFLRQVGCSDEEIAGRLGVTVEALERRRFRRAAS
jgi:DNA-binding transcriptional MerR regulator